MSEEIKDKALKKKILSSYPNVTAGQPISIHVTPAEGAPTWSWVRRGFAYQSSGTR